MNRKSASKTKSVGLLLGVLVLLGVHILATRDAPDNAVKPAVSQYTC